MLHYDRGPRIMQEVTEKPIFMVNTILKPVDVPHHFLFLFLKVSVWLSPKAKYLFLILYIITGSLKYSNVLKSLFFCISFL